MQQQRASSDSTSSTSSSEDTSGQCCLTAGHLFITCCLIILVMIGLLIASQFTDGLHGAWTPCLAIAGMATFLAFVSGQLFAFVEMRWHERYTVCKYLYCATCICCIDMAEIRSIFCKEETMCEMTESPVISSSADTLYQTKVAPVAPSTSNDDDRCQLP